VRAASADNNGPQRPAERFLSAGAPNVADGRTHFLASAAFCTFLVSALSWSHVSGKRVFPFLPEVQSFFWTRGQDALFGCLCWGEVVF
jgi:hypothetical protein